MTTGQRIAAKRKELELSQEALGETLGVSRQSIYKWESDTSLPDIDKLVALSRLFDVSVGWLLGVEETSAPQSSPQPPEFAAEGLTETQLHMVEEIVERYLATLPKPKKRKRWPMVLAGIVLFFAAFNLFEYFDVLDMRFESLNNNINRVENSVDYQISNITNRMEEILKSQNELTADYGTELTAWDLARNTVTFTARVVPKTYVEGMEVVFLADTGDGPAEYPADPKPGRAFTSEITCELTDSITLSAVFVNGDTRQTQILDTYEGLYRGSLPGSELSGVETAFLHLERSKDGLFHLPETTAWVRDRHLETETEFGTVKITNFQAGLFKNGQLLTWLEPTEKPQNWDVDAQHFFRFPGMDIALEGGDELSFALVFTDQYGRKGLGPSIPTCVCAGAELTWGSGDVSYLYDINNYTF